MKKTIYLLTIAAMLGCSQTKNGNAETADTVAAATGKAEGDSVVTPKNNIDRIPYYRILTTDSVFVTQENLKKNEPVILVYFSPDCDHCIKFVNEIKPHLKEFSKFQIVMITWTKYQTLQPFYDKMGFAAYKNITMGTEGDDLLVQQYFQIKDTPYIAIYDSKGKLMKTYAKPPKAAELVALAKKA